MLIDNKQQIYSVSTLTRELKNLVENKYRFIQVQGEISNLKVPFSGHHYFTLKDDGAQLRGVLFKGQSRYLEKALQDGQQVVCHGRISIYEPRGDYQIIVDSIDFHGSGLLQLQFEKLKKLLQTEGLFSQEKKQPLPQFPKEVVLVTSATGAAVHDFISIWRKRAFPAVVKIYPVRVQGDGAAKEIADAVKSVNRHLPATDIIVLCRGGGSLEDLWAFNEEVLARSIAASAIPVVSAVGHEVDYTISDFCSDVRAATPTAAAEQIFPDILKLQRQIAHLQEKMAYTVSDILAEYQNRVRQNRRLLGDMNSLFTNISLRLDHVTENFLGAMQKTLGKRRSQCDELSARLHSLSPSAKVQIQNQRLTFASEKLLYLMKQTLTDKAQSLGRQAALLDAVSPLATLARGYSIVEKITPGTGKTTLLRQSSQVKKGDSVAVRLHTGKLTCEVTEIQ